MSSIWLNDASTASCFRVGRHPIDVENFGDFHNTPQKIQQRETMLRGEWPQPMPHQLPTLGCRYCEKIEHQGGTSPRQIHLEIPGLVPKELETDANAVRVTPRILEVFLGNACNLSCTYCQPKLSSKIQAENAKFGEFDQNGVVLPVITVDRDQNSALVEAFFDWLATHGSELRRLQILGGEPMYQKDYYRCIDFFQDHPNPDLEFNTVTNLMIPTHKLQALLDQWRSMIARRQVRRFDVVVSVDCWGQEQEYARWGLDLTLLETNMRLLLEQKWLYLSVNSTISPLTIKTFPDLIAKIREWKEIHPINHWFQTVLYPAYHNPDIFGGSFWKRDLERAIQVMPDQTRGEQSSLAHLKGVAQQIAATKPQPEIISQFCTHLDELDRRRGTDWRRLFPYLADWQSHVV